jgi:Flp pilus assembly protein TadD
MADATHRTSSTLLLAQIDAAAGRLEEALRGLDSLKHMNAQRNEPPVQNLEFTRGDVLARMNRAAEAEKAFLEEIRWFPHAKQAYANLALVYLLQNRPADAHETLERMAQANPGRNTCLFAAKTLDALGDRAEAARWKRRADTAERVE